VDASAERPTPTYSERSPWQPRATGAVLAAASDRPLVTTPLLAGSMPIPGGIADLPEVAHGCVAGNVTVLVQVPLIVPDRDYFPIVPPPVSPVRRIRSPVLDRVRHRSCRPG
jgi:hypothetical protein